MKMGKGKEGYQERYVRTSSLQICWIQHFRLQYLNLFAILLVDEEVGGCAMERGTTGDAMIALNPSDKKTTALEGLVAWQCMSRGNIRDLFLKQTPYLWMQCP